MPLAQSLHTSAWALLDLLTTSWLQLEGSVPTMGLTARPLAPVLDILLSQLDVIAQQARENRSAQTGGLAIAQLKGGALPTKKVSEAEQARARKVGSTVMFGIHAASGPSSTASSATKPTATKFEDAFTIKVLNLAYKVSELQQGLDAITSERALSALLTVLRFSSPRVQLVTVRILQRALCSQSTTDSTCIAADGAVANSLPDEIAGVDTTAAAHGSLTVRALLVQVGRALSMPFASALLMNKTAMNLRLEQVQQLLGQLPMRTVLADDAVFPWVHVVDFVRIMVRDVAAWRPAVNAAVRSSFEQLSSVTDSLHTAAQADEAARVTYCSDMEQWQRLWLVLGGLAVCGGFVGTVCVGSVVRHTVDEYEAVVVSRHRARNTLQVLRSGAGDEGLPCVDANSFVTLPQAPFHFAAFDDLPPQLVLRGVLNTLRRQRDSFHALQELREAGEEVNDPTNFAKLALGQLYVTCWRTLHSIMYSPSVVEALSNEAGAVSLLFDAAVMARGASQVLNTPMLEDSLTLRVCDLASKALTLTDIIARPISSQ